MTMYVDKLPSRMCKDRMAEALDHARVARTACDWVLHEHFMQNARNWMLNAKHWLSIELHDNYTTRRSPDA